MFLDYSVLPLVVAMFSNRGDGARNEARCQPLRFENDGIVIGPFSRARRSLREIGGLPESRLGDRVRDRYLSGVPAVEEIRLDSVDRTFKTTE